MNIICVARNTWKQHWELFHHLPMSMAAHADVLYVQEPHNWSRGIQPRDEAFFRPRIEQMPQGVKLLKLPKSLCPRGREGAWNRWMRLAKSRLIQRHVANPAEPTVLYLWHNSLIDYARTIPADLIVYHIYDLTPPDAVGTDFMGSRFHESCEVADLVLTGTRQQANLVPRTDVEIVPNGVPFQDYQGELAEPQDMRGLPRPRIGYIGSINQRLDFDMLDAIAGQSMWQLVFIGPVRNITHEARQRFNRLCERPNVHYLGMRSPADVPKYMKSLDVGLLTYKPNTHMSVASPIKLYEYAAAGLPALSHPLPGLTGIDCDDVVRFASTPEEAVAVIRKELSQPASADDRERRLQFAAANSWNVRADQVMKLIRERLSQKQAAGPAVSSRLDAEAKHLSPAASS